MASGKSILVCLLVAISINFSNGYKPVAIVHGIMFNPKDHMEGLRDAILKSHPDTEVNLLEILHDQESFLPMWYQVSRFHAEIQKMVDKHPDGINVIGYSQGGSIARGVIESMPNHTIHTFISLSSPQAGFHGEWYVPNSVFHVGTEERLSDSVAGFWKDPKDLAGYKKDKRYLACLNNEVKHELNKQFKDAICKLKHLVLIGGPDDGIVVPWQSSQFGYDDENGVIMDMRNTNLYKNDCICLKTLDERQAITIHTVSGVKHPDWFNNATVIENYILPYLA
uniref:palmitoyl-CoA hydrolase n=1 Tax=Strigamia maritima TaxID=126957 RepID=T1IS89_STRMM